MAPQRLPGDSLGDRVRTPPEAKSSQFPPRFPQISTTDRRISSTASIPAGFPDPSPPIPTITSNQFPSIETSRKIGSYQSSASYPKQLIGGGVLSTGCAPTTAGTHGALGGVPPVRPLRGDNSMAMLSHGGDGAAPCRPTYLQVAKGTHRSQESTSPPTELPSPASPQREGRRRRRVLFILPSSPLGRTMGCDSAAGLLGRPQFGPNTGTKTFPRKPSLRSSRPFEKVASSRLESCAQYVSPPSPRSHGAQEQSRRSEQWHVVRRKRWWRREACLRSQSFSSASRQESRLLSNRDWFQKTFKGKCCKCLANDHLASSCRDPVKCLRCRRNGHLSRHCPAPTYLSQSNSPPTYTSPLHLHSQRHLSPPPPTSSQPSTHNQQISWKAASTLSAMDRLLASASRRSTSTRRLSSAAREARTVPLQYPLGDNHSRPRYSFKSVATSPEMVLRRDTMLHHAILVTEEGRLRVESRDELAEAVSRFFGVRHFDFQVYRHRPEPFMMLFSDRRVKEAVEERRVIDWGDFTFRFHPWRVDRYAERAPHPYYVKLFLEGIPLHAWNEEVAATIICDECVIHRVEEATRNRTDTRFYELWAFARDPFAIPQRVYLTIADPDERRPNAYQVTLERPTEIKRGFVYTILIHLDSAEDLLYYHYPPHELDAEGRQRFRDFVWVPGRADGQDEDEQFVQQWEQCRRLGEPRGRRDNDDEDSSRGRSRSRALLSSINRWRDNKGKNRAADGENSRRSGWFKGESSRKRRSMHSASPPPGDRACPEERRALRLLWQAKPDVQETKNEQNEVHLGKEQHKSMAALAAEEGAEDLWSTEAQCSSRIHIPDAATTESNGDTPTDAILIDACSFVVENESIISHDFQLQQEKDSVVIEVPLQDDLFNSAPQPNQGVNQTTEQIQDVEADKQHAALDMIRDIYEDGEEEPEVLDADPSPSTPMDGGQLQSFIGSISAPVKGALLGTPPPAAKSPPVSASAQQEGNRRSDRLKQAQKADKPALQLAQEVLAKKMGVIPENQKFDDEACKAYLRSYDKPLPIEAIKIVNQLIEATAGKTKKKKKTGAGKLKKKT